MRRRSVNRCWLLGNIKRFSNTLRDVKKPQLLWSSDLLNLLDLVCLWWVIVLDLHPFNIRNRRYTRVVRRFPRRNHTQEIDSSSQRFCVHIHEVSRSLMVDFILFSLFNLFYFTLLFLFNFLFLEQLGLGVISHAVTSVTNWWRSHKTDHGTWEKEVEGSGTKWHHTA